MGGVTFFRVLIVLLVFPVSAHLVFTVITAPLRPVLAPLFARTGEWAGVLETAFVVLSLLVALRGSYSFCQRLWPNPTFRELRTAEAPSRSRPR